MSIKVNKVKVEEAVDMVAEAAAYSIAQATIMGQERTVKETSELFKELSVAIDGHSISSTINAALMVIQVAVERVREEVKKATRLQ